MATFRVETGTSINLLNKEELIDLMNHNVDLLKDKPLVVEYKGYKIEVSCNPYHRNLMGYIEGTFDKINPIYNEVYVHGDWTYPYDGLDSSKPIVKIGFDCGHSSDLHYSDVMMSEEEPYGSYKDIDFVLTELKRVIDEYLIDNE